MRASGSRSGSVEARGAGRPCTTGLRGLGAWAPDAAGAESEAPTGVFDLIVTEDATTGAAHAPLSLHVDTLRNRQVARL